MPRQGILKSDQLVMGRFNNNCSRYRVCIGSLSVEIRVECQSGSICHFDFSEQKSNLGFIFRIGVGYEALSIWSISD